MRVLALLVLPLSACCFAPNGGASVTPPAPSPVAIPPTPSVPPEAAPAPAPPGTSVPAPASPTPSTPRVRAEGFDVRAIFWSDPMFVLQRGHTRRPESEGDSDGDITVWRLGAGSGDPVRIVRQDQTTCDGTLGARVRVEAEFLDVESEDRAALASEVEGCTGRALFAIVHPTPGAPWPERLSEGDAAGGPALAAARAAMSEIERRASPEDHDAIAYRLEGAIYGLAWGPRCGDDDEMGCLPVGAALVAIREGGTPETLIVRRVHLPWDEPTGAGYAPCGVTDVDGDGSVELCERMLTDQGTMVRLVRPSDRRAGEMVWRVEETAEYTLPLAGPAPRPLSPPPTP